MTTSSVKRLLPAKARVPGPSLYRLPLLSTPLICAESVVELGFLFTQTVRWVPPRSTSFWKSTRLSAVAELRIRLSPSPMVLVHATCAVLPLSCTFNGPPWAAKPPLFCHWTWFGP